MRRPLLLRLLLALTLLAPLPLSLLHALPFLLAPITPPPEGLRLTYGLVVLPFFARVDGAWQQVNLTCTVTLVVGGRAEYSCPNGYAEVVSPYLERVNSTFFLGPPSRAGSEGLQGAGGVHWYAAAPGSLPATFTTRRLITAELQRRVVVLRALSVAPGDTLVPHLYDWYFDGINDYILCDCYDALKVTTGLTLAARILVYPDSPTGRGIVQKNPSAGNYDYMFYLSSAGYSSIYVRNASGASFVATEVEDVRGKGWRYWVGTFDGVYLRFYRDGVLRDSRVIGPTTLQATDTPLTIAYGWNGYVKVSVSHAIIFNRALNDTEVSDLYATNVVRNNSDLVFFVDPTWCTGDTCFNLAYPSAACRMYNGVARVPANQTWLWVVKGLRSDTRVGLRFFPAGSVIVFRDASGTPVAVVEADGGDAIEVDLPPGSYTVEAYVPAHSVAVVPHLYDWSSGGSNGYVIAGLQPDGTGKPLTLHRWGAFTVAARLRIDRHTSTGSVTSLGLGTNSSPSGPVLTLTAPGDFSGVWYYASVWSSSGFEAYTVPLPLQSVESQWRWYAVTYVNRTRTLTGLLDSTAVGSATLRGDMYFITDLNPASLPSPYSSQMRRLAVFSNTGPGDYSRGLASFVALWARALPAGELQQLQGAYAVSGALLELFIDPTMWNGTHYLSLVNGYVARAYSGATRVPAEQVWLWQVSLAGAGEVVLAWIPPGSFVRVRGGGTEVAALGRRVGDSRVLHLRAVDGSFAVVRYTVELAWFPTATGDWFSFQPSFGYEAWGRVA
ncbi:MAG: LamG domain-containing protein, partial [Armatimonadota bacterium]|nr:LamG domain-containing protein [Armatimonadota bacterium]